MTTARGCLLSAMLLMPGCPTHSRTIHAADPIVEIARTSSARKLREPGDDILLVRSELIVKPRYLASCSTSAWNPSKGERSEISNRCVPEGTLTRLACAGPCRIVGDRVYLGDLGKVTITAVTRIGTEPEVTTSRSFEVVAADGFLIEGCRNLQVVDGVVTRATRATQATTPVCRARLGQRLAIAPAYGMRAFRGHAVALAGADRTEVNTAAVASLPGTYNVELAFHQLRAAVSLELER
jgi:hypothetical protein